MVTQQKLKAVGEPQNQVNAVADRGTRALAVRLAAEFMVIVTGVLVALGVDSWVSSRNDRALEAEYLERLLDDVRYDMAELAFVDSISGLGAAASQQLTSPEGVDALSDSRLTAAVFVAGNVRRADPSRATFLELINSGQIELIRSMEIRRALAGYHRTIDELASAWDQIESDWRAWSWARIPAHLFNRFVVACSGLGGQDIYNYQEVCEFDLGDWAAGPLRAQVKSQEAQRLLRLAEYDHQTHSFFAASLLGEAESLAHALEQEIGRRQVGLSN